MSQSIYLKIFNITGEQIEEIELQEFDNKTAEDYNYARDLIDALVSTDAVLYEGDTLAIVKE